MFFLSFILGEGWQSGIQATAADWDENWDKFEDEGIPIPFLLKDAFIKQLNFCELFASTGFLCLITIIF